MASVSLTSSSAAAAAATTTSRRFSPPTTPSHPHPSNFNSVSLPLSSRTSQVASASKNWRGRGGRGWAPAAPEKEEEKLEETEIVDDGFVMPELPGMEPDFWEGEKWDNLGFFIDYMWAFGVGFALIACGIAVATYNEGASDFKETPAYKESTLSREALEGPEASNSDVFESNPTEEAPSLD
ncbi:hypothetical protein AKJ16_DCAP11383 [Drosera capensis]